MPIEIAVPACGLSDESWEKLPKPERALMIAIQEIKYHREPDGAVGQGRVIEMLRKAKSRPDMPWSAAFVAWCLGGAGIHPNVLYPASPHSWIEWAVRYRRLRMRSPMRGDLYYIDRPGKCHIGMIAKLGAHKIIALEGNVFQDGRLEGPMAALVARPKNQVDGYISMSNPSIPSAAKALLAA